MEFIITNDSFQYIGRPEELTPWQEDKYLAWYKIPWENPENSKSNSPSERLFSQLALFFHKTTSSTRDINLLREKVDFNYDYTQLTSDLFQDDLANYKDKLTKDWLDIQFSHLHNIFKKEIKNYPDSVGQYYKEKGLDFPVPDRIFFHLVETKGQSDTYPFAFMASYSEKEGQQINHYPSPMPLINIARTRVKS